MNSVQERIGELEELLAKAQEVDGEERDRRAALRAIESQRKKAIKDLQAMIKKGQSSGDAALDIEIMFRDSISRTGSYLGLGWLQTAINRHPDDLVVLRMVRSHWKMGVLPKSPVISWHIDPKGPFKNVEIAVQRSCWDPNSGYKLLPRMVEEPLRVLHHGFEPVLQATTLEGDFADIDRHLEIAVGSEAVQQWMEALDVNTALKIYIAARLLGRPLKLYPELTREIRDRRERFIPALIEAMDEVKRLEDHLAEGQHSPAWGLQNPPRTRGTVEPKIIKTEDGVTIDFGFTHMIKNARQTLWSMVNNAALGCDMADNPTWQQAADMIGYELPS